MIRETYIDGVLRERWDDTTRTYTAWDASGVQTSTRPYTAAENAAADASAAALAASTNLATLQQRAQNALTNNATYLAIASPTQAQAVAQVGKLTRQMNALIRITINQLQDISDS